MKTKAMEPRKAANNVEPQRRVKDAHLKFDEEGSEIMDPTPIAPPIGYKKAPSIAEQIRAMVRSEKLRQEAEAAGYESFEEADDFDVDDFDPRSPYEEVFEPMPQVTEEDRLKSLGTHIGSVIMSQLGEAPQPEGSPGTPPAPTQREQPGASPHAPMAEKRAPTQASGFLKPRAT